MLMQIEKDIFYKENGLIVRRAEKQDAKILAPKLSAHDVHEAWAMTHSSSQEALDLGLSSSIFALTIEHQGSIIGMMGIIPDEILGKKAQIWFLASDELIDIGRIFLRNAKKFVDMFLSYYPYLYNYVHVENTKSILWMKFVGFQVEEPKPVGIDKELFHYFYIKLEV